VNRHQAALDSNSATQLFQGGVGHLLNESVELPHLRLIQSRGIVAARKGGRATGLSIALQPPLKRREVDAVELRHLGLAAQFRFIRCNRSLSHLRTRYSHASIINA